MTTLTNFSITRLCTCNASLQNILNESAYKSSGRKFNAVLIRVTKTLPTPDVEVLALYMYSKNNPNTLRNASALLQQYGDEINQPLSYYMHLGNNNLPEIIGINSKNKKVKVELHLQYIK